MSITVSCNQNPLCCIIISYNVNCKYNNFHKATQLVLVKIAIVVDVLRNLRSTDPHCLHPHCNYNHFLHPQIIQCQSNLCIDVILIKYLLIFMIKYATIKYDIRPNLIFTSTIARETFCNATDDEYCCPNWQLCYVTLVLDAIAIMNLFLLPQLTQEPFLLTH